MCTMNPDDLTSGQRLMAESRHMGVEVKVAADKLDRLEAENAKLRELIKDMWRDIPKSEACAWDSSANTCIGSDSCIGECSYWYRMVKLGFEPTCWECGVGE